MWLNLRKNVSEKHAVEILRSRALDNYHTLGDTIRQWYGSNLSKVPLKQGFSRYGYVYCFKHKHEVFETFKVFKAEVELQLGKKIKALRSDRGGEYLSQEFKDYLRGNRYTNRYGRSMFNLTTYRYPFGTYALESAECIFVDYPKETMGYTFTFLLENNVIVASYGDFLERDLISQEFSGRIDDLEALARI
ncbi:retrotransposon protein, putative, ty1-copia subclass [Tanacetum coccineum]